MDPKERAMGPMGIAPKLLPVILPFILAATAASILVPGWVDFQGKLRGAGFAAGIVIAALALPFYIDMAVRLIRALARKKLATRGTYAFCRHPLYAWWIFLVLPAAALFFDNWLFLLCSVPMFIAVKKYVGEEDDYLGVVFGAEYAEYRKNTRELVPIPKRRLPILPALGKFVLFCLAVSGWLLITYALVIRPVASTFGSSADELAATYPADELVPDPNFSFTQGVTIDAPVGEVWKWLIQVGYKRAGWYNVDTINGMVPGYFYEGNGSAKRIIPELQKIRVGDRISIAPGADLDVIVLEPERSFVFAGFMNLDAGGGYAPKTAGQGDSRVSIVWGYHLKPTADGKTRLTGRFRSRAEAGLPLLLIFEIADMIGGGIIQQPAMFHGLKARAEGRIR